MSKDATNRKELRKETAKKFFDIVERLGAIIPKWLLAMPEHLKECDFDKWKTETSKGENRQLAECIKDFSQFCHLRKKLLEIGEVLAETCDNRRLRKLVIHKIETEVKDDVGDVQIGTPTVVKK